MRNLKLKHCYSSSFALVIGINKYQKASPLQTAVNDAEEIASVLEKKFLFSQENICLLTDKDASKQKILSEYMSFEKKTDLDSRLFVFFAGHGFTQKGIEGEAGFLVPYDGDINDLSTLIRWEEFTNNTDIISAKHIFFVMDACYGGLFFKRKISAGAVRFLNDMLIRPVIQALTSGKKEEEVSDSGGPREGHSIFTGYLIEALEGAARSPEGHLTASEVMSYVYRNVSHDIDSEQTPHYGSLKGDGEFIFDAPQLNNTQDDSKSDHDSLITISSLFIPEEEGMISDSFLLGKQYISDPKYYIQLNDYVIKLVRKFIIESSDDKFIDYNKPITADEISKRLSFYEEISRDLKRILSCLAYWGDEKHVMIISKVFKRLLDSLNYNHINSGNWEALRWYPYISFLYSVGISLITNEKYNYFGKILYTDVFVNAYNGKRINVLIAVCDSIVGIVRKEYFKYLPGYERIYVPLQEHLFKILQPDLDNDLFLGKDYESLYDRFEVLLALVSAYILKKNDEVVWGPVGRFGWKYHSRSSYDNPIMDIAKEVNEKKNEWLPFKAGLFGNDLSFLVSIFTEYQGMIANNRMW